MLQSLSTISNFYFIQKISSQIANFSIEMFLNMLTDRKNRVDEQILDTL
jgi:hypothetical protein